MALQYSDNYHNLNNLGLQTQRFHNNSNHRVLTISLSDNGEIIINDNESYSTTINEIKYSNNRITYTYDKTKEKITNELKEYLTGILYHKINSELTVEEEQLQDKKTKMKGFNKFLRTDKIKRLL